MENFSPQNQIVNAMQSSCNEEHITVQITDNPTALSLNSPNTPLKTCMESSKSMDIDRAVATVVTIGTAAFNPQMDRSHTKSSSFVAGSVESESSLLQQSGSVGNAGYLTLTGTIRRGKKAGQTTEIVVPVDKERLDFLESVVVNEENMQSAGNPRGCSCSCDQGLHILLWSIFCAPFIFLLSLIYCFYMGTITWHNVFVLFSEEKSCIYKLFVPPILILCFPVLVIPCAIIIALYSTLAQLSWRWGRWVEAAFDLEKGYFGWVCNLLGIDECAPYQEIVLNEVQHVKRPDAQP